METKDDEILVYEVKCRRCGNLTEWAFGQKNNINGVDFFKAMQDYIQYPRTRRCVKCDKSTVSDVVSYSEY